MAEHEPDRIPYMGETVRGPWLVSVTGPSASDLGFRDAEPFATQHAALARVRQIEAELRRLPHTEA